MTGPEERAASRRARSALSYLLYRHFRNRIVRGVKSLRRPKYLVGLIAGLLWFSLLFRWSIGDHPSPAGGLPLKDLRVIWEPLGAALLLGLTVVLWSLPGKSPAFLFSPAEIEFLFPAPLARRDVVRYVLVKGQFGLLFMLFFLLLFSRGGPSGEPVFFALGFWALLSVVQLHVILASYVRSALRERGFGTLWRAVLVPAGAAAIFALGVLWNIREQTSWPGLLLAMSREGPAAWALVPFRALVRPILATDWTGFLSALPFALGIGALHYLWIVRADVAFEEASIAASEKIAKMIEARRRGAVFFSESTRPAKRRPPFRLVPSGLRFVALTWKNLISSGRIYSARTLLVALVLAALVGWILPPLLVSSWRPLLLVPIPFLLILGMSGMRGDLRMSLAQADLLKTFPVRSSALVLGESLATTLITTAFLWVGLVYGSGIAYSMAEGELDLMAVASAGLAIAIVALPFGFLRTLLVSATGLLFPTWGTIGRAATTPGISNMGQRIVLALLQMIAFLFALLPAIVVFAVVFAIGQTFLGWMALVPAAVVGAVPILLEAVGLLFLLAVLFDRFDVSTELETV